MGLDTTHDCWHGAYSAFSRWRDSLAEAAGYSSHQHESGGTIWDLDWANIERTIGGELLGVGWPCIPYRPDGTQDPLIILLAHSDCEGVIEHKWCLRLAERLEELQPLLEGKSDMGHIGLYTEKTQSFIDGLRFAHAEGEDVVFH